MKIPFSPPDIREEDIAAVVQVLRSGWITSGPVGEEFRQALTNFCGSKDTILLNSATAGLKLALRLLGIGEGDEVIVPAYTYTASAAVIHHVGAKIVMVDVAKGQYFPDPTAYENAITPRTKAIITVDLGGVPVDLEPIYTAIDTKRHLYQANNKLQESLGRVAIIADGAHSLGGIRKQKRTGNIADFTAFSFHAVKNLTTGEGGALTWAKHVPFNSEELLQIARLNSLHGQTKSALDKTNSASWEYDIAFPGYKQNMADIMAALGLSQLKRYEETINRRLEIVKKYDTQLLAAGCKSLTHIGEDYRSSGHLYLLSLTGHNVVERNDFINKMSEQGISCNVHYKPLPLLSAYKNLGFNIADFPNAYAQYVNEVTLPLHTCLTEEQVDFVATTATNLFTTHSI